MIETIIALVFTAITVIFTLVISVVAAVVPMLIMGVVIYLMIKNGGSFVVSGPLAHAIASGAAAQSATKVNLVKVSTCHACGAHRTTPSPSAYVHCDQCGQLTDWDFKAAMNDRRSKAPGPQYESLLARAQKGLGEAKKNDDRDAYMALQREIWEAYARACPAACPPRVGDEHYRKQWVEWSAISQTEQDLDPGCAETFAAQQAATQGLQWDRSNPFKPMVELTSYRALLDAVLAHQEQVGGHLESIGHLAEHPDHPEAAVFKTMGAAVFVQGWLGYLPQSEHDATLKATGLDGDYIEPPQVDLTKGECPSCSAPLEVPANAKRVVCIACGHGVSVKGGSLPCMGCGSTIEIPSEGSSYSCPHCELRVERIGLA